VSKLLKFIPINLEKMKSYYLKVFKEMKYTVNLFLTIAIACIAMFASCEDESKSGSSDLEIDKTDIEVSSIGGITLISVNTGLTWTASANANWVNLEPASGNGSGAITVKFDSCTGPQRTAEIIVYSGSIAKTVNVLQRGNQREEYWKQGEIIKLHQHYSQYGSIAIVIIGDGFDKEDCKKGGMYESNCRKLADLFLSMPVIRDYAHCFDILARVDISRERGVRNCVADIEDGHREKCADNAYGSGHDDLRWDKIRSNATLTAGKDDRSVIFMANGMIGGAAYGDIAVYSANEPKKHYWMMHEFAGHIVGKFPDLYYIYGDAPATDGTRQAIDFAHQNGEMLMFDYKTDPEEVYWRDFINKDSYTEVGVFPAAYWDLKLGELTSCESVYTSTMFNEANAHYTVMERYQLWRQILIRSGESLNTPPTIVNFKAYDKVNLFDSDWTWDRYDNWIDDRVGE
jgi:hypothetical protein